MSDDEFDDYVKMLLGAFAALLAAVFLISIFSAGLREVEKSKSVRYEVTTPLKTYEEVTRLTVGNEIRFNYNGNEVTVHGQYAIRRLDDADTSSNGH